MRRPLVLPTAALLVLGLAAVPATARTAHAAGYKNCRMSPSEAQHMGPSYIVDGQYKVQSVSCSRGKAVIRAFHQCRKAHGGMKRGRCPRSVSVLGYHCTEKRSANANEITGAVTCVFGSRKVFHYYTNFT